MDGYDFDGKDDTACQAVRANAAVVVGKVEDCAARYCAGWRDIDYCVIGVM